GELEITFLKNFGRAGNLAALLEDDKLPDSLRPYTSRLRSLISSSHSHEKRLSNSKVIPLRDNILDLLVERMNNPGVKNCKWVTPEEWSLYPESESIEVSPVHPQAIFHQQVRQDDATYSTFTQNPKNCIVMFKSQDGVKMFGRIFSIFTHHQPSKSSQSVLETWFHIQCFPEVPKTNYNPFKRIETEWPDARFYLRSWGPTQDKLVRLDEVVAHCAWVMYKPREIHEINIPTIALVSCVQ
ncbi:hypothetical protein DFH28DRAFT_897000, partial [Melampsora americana]